MIKFDFIVYQPVFPLPQGNGMLNILENCCSSSGSISGKEEAEGAKQTWGCGKDGELVR